MGARSWSADFFDYVIVKPARNNAVAVRKHQCMVCALKRLMDFSAANGERRARGEEDVVYEPHVWDSDGCFLTRNADKMERHLENMHSLCNPATPEGAHGTESARIVTDFKQNCRRNDKVHGWSFKSADVAQQLNVVAFRQAAQKAAMPPLQRLCLMFAGSYYSFMSIDREQTRLFFAEHVPAINPLPDRRALSLLMKKHASALLDKALTLLATSNGGRPVPVYLTIDVASTRTNKRRQYARYWGVALSARGFPPLLIKLLSDNAVVARALQNRGVEMEDGQDELDDDAVEALHDEAIHLDADSCRAALNALIVELESRFEPAVAGAVINVDENRVASPGFRVVGVTTDNGSNMRKMADDQNGIFALRCACHTFFPTTKFFFTQFLIVEPQKQET